ncbi:MAG TPA: C4-dicarboxylate ABC transporter substrate-binding protein, partial [Bacillota bacterium]|nr:C4-dicarboxylate ABC transporter substrate-binding protein [Bacillota bacterium]
MKNLYRFMLVALSIIMVFSLAACSGSEAPAAPAEPSASGEPTVLKLGMTINEQDSFYVCAQKFADLVKERTDNAYNIELFPNSALGDERTMLESMQ